jgi:hypothetical protein
MMIVYVFELSVATMAAGGAYGGIPPRASKRGFRWKKCLNLTSQEVLTRGGLKRAYLKAPKGPGDP